MTFRLQRCLAARVAAMGCPRLLLPGKEPGGRVRRATVTLVVFLLGLVILRDGMVGIKVKKEAILSEIIAPEENPVLCERSARVARRYD